MQGIAATARLDGSGRILVSVVPPTRAAWHAALGRFRLPSYRAVLFHLADVRHLVRVTSLWAQVFGDRPPSAPNAFDLLLDFVARVNRELFRVDLEELDHYQNMLWDLDADEEDENPPESVLDLPIPILGYGIPWEMGGLGECSHSAQPLLAVLAPYLESDHLVGLALFEDSVRDYWADRGRPAPEWGLPEEGVAAIRVLQAALRLQPPPFDGLAGVIDCILRNTTSIFLNEVSGGYSCEYDEDDGIWDFAENWNVETIRFYAQAFSRVRPVVEATEAYDDWYEETPGAEGQVLALLERLVAGNWHVEEDKVIFHD